MCNIYWIWYHMKRDRERRYTVKKIWLLLFLFLTGCTPTSHIVIIDKTIKLDLTKRYTLGDVAQTCDEDSKIIYEFNGTHKLNPNDIAKLENGTKFDIFTHDVNRQVTCTVNSK